MKMININDVQHLLSLNFFLFFKFPKCLGFDPGYDPLLMHNFSLEFLDFLDAETGDCFLNAG